ncbi:hypothetical protein EDB89DRAFT_2026929, partial [Lactarius sanguifluus]
MPDAEVTRTWTLNRHFRLKNGAISAQLEKSLLGAEVNRIVDRSVWISVPPTEDVLIVALDLEGGLPLSVEHNHKSATGTRRTGTFLVLLYTAISNLVSKLLHRHYCTFYLTVI